MEPTDEELIALHAGDFPGVTLIWPSGLRAVYEAGVAAERKRCAKAILDQAEIDEPSNSALYDILIDRIYSDS